MNEETNDSFNLDVTAEQQAFSSVISPSTIESPQFSTPLKEIPLPDSISIEAGQFLKLPDSVAIKPSNLEYETSAVAEVSKTAIDLEVKFDAEASYRNLYDQVTDMQGTLNNAVNSLTNTWIPDPKAASKFEERPSLDPTNIIFDARRERFSQYPHWA